SSNARRPAARRILEGHLLENPTLREMNLACVRFSKKTALGFSKTILDRFSRFFIFDTSIENLTPKGRTSTDADWIRPGVDPRPESGNAGRRTQPGRMQAHLRR